MNYIAAGGRNTKMKKKRNEETLRNEVKKISIQETVGQLKRKKGWNLNGFIC